MRHVGAVHILLLGRHMEYGHTQRAVYLLNLLHGILIRELAVADNHRATFEGVVHGSVGTTILRTPHRVCCHEAASVRVHHCHLAELLLRRAHIHQYLVGAYAVEDFCSHHRQGVHRGCQHDKVALVESLVEGDDGIYQAEFEGTLSTLFRVLNARNIFT